MADAPTKKSKAHAAVGMPAPRYVKLAEALLSAPTVEQRVYAIAHELGDHAGRLDALHKRLSALEAKAARVGGEGSGPDT